jgi:hypothetical protein
MVSIEDRRRCWHAQQSGLREEVARRHSINPRLTRPRTHTESRRHAVGALFVPAAQPHLEEARSATARIRLDLAACQPGITVDTLFATWVPAIG